MASLAVVVDGVKCRLNFKRANIVVGTTGTAAERKHYVARWPPRSR